MMMQRTLRSKSFWAGLAMVIAGIGLCVAGNVGEGVQTIAGGVVTIFVRDAISKLEPAGGESQIPSPGDSSSRP
jgi:hypothetical protein